LRIKDFLLATMCRKPKIDAFAANPTDENISSVQTLALGTKDALRRRGKPQRSETN